MKHRGTSRGLPLLLLALWLALLGAGLVLFHGVSEGPLAAPPLDPRTWGVWLADRDALIATVAILRLLVLALTWYLIGATAIGLVARLARSVQVIRIADAMTIPALRRLLQASVGLSLATGVVVSAMPAGVAVAAVPAAAVASDLEAPPIGDLIGDLAARRSHLAADRGDEVVAPPLRLIRERAGNDVAERSATLGSVPPSVPPLRRLDVPPSAATMPNAVGAPVRNGREIVLRHLGPTGANGAPGEGGPASSDGAASERPTAGLGRLPGLTGSADVAVVEVESSQEGAAGSPGSVDVEGPTEPAVHVVVAGESLWTIASDIVAVALGRAPSDAEVADYWLELIEVQRPYLANPDDPDLIFPGERVRLPTMAGRWDR